MTKTRAQIEVELSAENLRIQENSGNGDCFFKAVAISMHLNQESGYKSLRTLAVDYITQHKDYFAPFVTDTDNIDEFISNMSKTGVHADQQVVAALSNMLGLTIEIISPHYPEPFFAIPEEQVHHEVVTLFFENEHYQSIIPNNAQFNGETQAWYWE